MLKTGSQFAGNTSSQWKIVASVAAMLLAAGTQSRASTSIYNATALPSSPFGKVDIDVTTSTPTGTSVTDNGTILSVGPTTTTGYDFLGFSGALAGFTLDHTQTVRVSATARLDAEATLAADVNNRAGLGIALTDDRNEYTELYINGSTIFLNQSGRVRGAAVPAPSDVESAFHTYALQLSGDTVSVYLDNVLVPSLTENIFTPPVGNVLTLANTAAVGDITSDSSSTFDVSNFTVSVSPVPEPASISLLSAGLIFAAARPKRARR